MGQDTEAPPVITIDDYERYDVGKLISAPPSLTTSPWTQMSIKVLGMQLQLSLVSRLECGQAQSCL